MARVYIIEKDTEEIVKIIEAEDIYHAEEIEKEIRKKINSNLYYTELEA